LGSSLPTLFAAITSNTTGTSAGVARRRVIF
jgi:hypothetical protein